jgi:hypothetical protein
VLDLLFQAGVIWTQRGADVLGVGAVRAGGEADEVDEEDRDDLALLSSPHGSIRERGPA